MDIREVPKNWTEAKVVSIYKGSGTDTDPANYRPMSLPNTIYRIFASMLQARVAQEHDGHVRDTQFGFRAKKGPSIHCLSSEGQWNGPKLRDNQCTMCFWIWEQAFDSIDHNAMLVALQRFGISPRALSIIKGTYQNPKFETTSAMGDKAEGTVGSGIRQGCRLSAYLLIMVPSVIFEDVDYALRAQGQPVNTWSVARPVYDLEYADDTLHNAAAAHPHSLRKSSQEIRDAPQPNQNRDPC